jgi:thiamine phosphate synthase YjbQ (UPF0047 family)
LPGHRNPSVFVNDSSDSPLSGIERSAKRLAPRGEPTDHRAAESNRDAHLKELPLGH